MHIVYQYCYSLNKKEFRCIEYLEKALERIQDKKSNLYKDLLCDIVMKYPASKKNENKFNTFLNEALRILPKEKNMIRQKISNLFSLGEEKQAIDLFRRLTTTSDYTDNENNTIRADNVMTTLYSEYMSVNECFENHKVVAQYYSKSNNYEYSHSFHRFKDMNSLRVGFVSPDFSAHSVSYFLNKSSSN